MTFEFYEGPAGTGKTYSILNRASELVQEGVLGENQKLLALTFMNGARRRLLARLRDIPVFRGRYECQTFDVFARSLAARRKSLITPQMQDQADVLNEFDGPCFLAAELLESEAVQRWISRSFPIILVDEAQDLDPHRMRILQGLSVSSSVIVAADAFQCLYQQRDTVPLMTWLEGAGQTRRLSEPMRTQQQGLLEVALAIKEARDITEVLTQSRRARLPTFYAQGFRLVESYATNAGIIGRKIADEISFRNGRIAILSPNMSNQMLRDALENVHSRTWIRNEVPFGPFPFTWDHGEDDEVEEILAGTALPEFAQYTDMVAMLAPFARHPAIVRTINRMDRLRRVQGQNEFSAIQVNEFVQESLREISRHGFRRIRGNLAMTIHRAKNREFDNVILLWPHALPANASPEHLRRLLYNGITRAQEHCTVIVLGQNRLNGPPFRP